MQVAVPTSFYEKLRSLGRYKVLNEILTLVETELDLPRSNYSLIEGYLTRHSNVMWRRSLPYAEVPSFTSISDLGPDGDDGFNAYDYVIIYRLLNEDELIALQRPRSERILVVVDLVRNDAFAPHVFQLGESLLSIEPGTITNLLK